MLNTVFSNDIRQTLDQFRRSVDHLFDNFYGYPVGPGRGQLLRSGRSGRSAPCWKPRGTTPRCACGRSCPGVRQGDFNVSHAGQSARHLGRAEDPRGLRQPGLHAPDVWKVQTSVALPTGLDVEKVRCELHDGVLDISIPVAESMKPRQVPIQVSVDQQKAIGA